jgi:hypothetical protein
MLFPNTKEWGPQLWFILHTFAEQLGKIRDPKQKLLEYEEAIHIELLLKNIYKILPCNTCKKHAKEFILANPIKWNKMRGDELKNAVREWLWRFHNCATTTEAATAKIDLEMLPAIYKNDSMTASKLSTAFSKVVEQQKLGIPYRLVADSDLIIFRQRYHELYNILFSIN